MSNAPILRANPDFMTRSIAGETILIPVGGSALGVQGILTLSESGCLLWSRLQTGATVEELADCLTAEYEIDRPTAQADVSTFLNKLRSYHMLQEGEQ